MWLGIGGWEIEEGGLLKRKSVEGGTSVLKVPLCELDRFLVLVYCGWRYFGKTMLAFIMVNYILITVLLHYIYSNFCNDKLPLFTIESWVELNLSSQGGSGVVTPNSVNNAGGKPLPIHCTTNMEKLLMEAQRDQSRSTSRGSSRDGR